MANPANSRTALAAFITAAKKELLIYDPKVSDRAMLRLLEERKNAGVEEAAKPEKGSRRKCRGWHPRRMSRRSGMNLPPKLILALTARVLLLTTCAAGLAQHQSEPAGVQDDTRIVADFGSRVAKYIDLRKKAGDSPKPAKEPAKLAESRKQIADKVVTERADAKLRRGAHSGNRGLFQETDRRNDFRSKQDMEVGLDTERAFMIVEIAGDNLYFQTISRTGQTIDSGTRARQ